MKIIAFYLPQFHCFPENDEWWGKGFTEWTNTKKAVPLYKGHYEPRTPLNNNFYDLMNPQTFMWQISLAKKYGIYGFCFYHYWFSGKKLMEKPIEMYLNNTEYDLPFCICWANETWSRRWNGREQDVLIKQEHGNETEWEHHFYYLLPFFKDSRYIHMDGKPLFVLYKPEIFPEYKKMFQMWEKLAIENGLAGLTFAIQSAIWNTREESLKSSDYKIMFEPGYTGMRKGHKLSYKVVAHAITFYAKHSKKFNAMPISFDEYCKDIIFRPVNSDKLIPGMFVNWDNTPRKKEKGSVTLFNSPAKFEKYLSLLISKTKNEYKKDYIFINAWNEWAEGCYLEPDDKYEYAYLEAVKQALIENKEFLEN